MFSNWPFVYGFLTASCVRLRGLWLVCWQKCTLSCVEASSSPHWETAELSPLVGVDSRHGAAMAPVNLLPELPFPVVTNKLPLGRYFEAVQTSCPNKLLLHDFSIY